jgi:drug/metabolite transporter (DMT)-like permease
MFKYMRNNSIPMLLSASWRCQCMSIFLIPFAIIEYMYLPVKERTEWFSYKPDLQFPVVVHIILAGIFWSVNLESWVYGLQFTTTVRASVFASCHPLMLVVVLSLLGQKVASLEWGGVAVVICGLCLCSGRGFFDSSGSRMMVVGDGLCLVAAMAEVLTLLNRSKTKQYVPLMQVSRIVAAVLSM